MFTRPTAEKLRVAQLEDARLELEQRTLQLEELAARRDMLAARVERLQRQVSEDELESKKRIASIRAGASNS